MKFLAFKSIYAVNGRDFGQPLVKYVLSKDKCSQSEWTLFASSSNTCTLQNMQAAGKHLISRLCPVAELCNRNIEKEDDLRSQELDESEFTSQCSLCATKTLIVTNAAWIV